MATRIEIVIDKSVWPAGPWHDEPDHEAWIAHGLCCVIERTPMGHLCGYVGVASGHPWHGKGDGEVDADVHGGITWAQDHAPRNRYLRAPGMPEPTWWLGFDCAHLGDLSPRSLTYGVTDLYRGDLYRDLAYVRAQCEALAEQAASAAR